MKEIAEAEENENEVVKRKKQEGGSYQRVSQEKALQEIKSIHWLK